MQRKMFLKCCLLLLLPLAAAAGPGNTAFRRTVVKEFTVGSGASLNIANKYGKVALHTWDKNTIRATIVITGFGKNEEAAKEMAGMVSIRSVQANDGVSLETSYTTGANGSFWQRLFGEGGKGGRQYVNIDYDVYLPRSLANLNVSNNYGDVLGDNLASHTSLQLNYGNFHLGNISGEVKLQANYSHGSFGNVTSLEANANYSEIRVDRAGSLQARSNYSEYKLGKIGTLTNHSNYDEFTAGDITDAVSHSNYTDYDLGKLSRSADMDITYGDLKVRSVGNGLHHLSINGTYADIALGLPRNATLGVDIRLTHGDINTGGLPFQHIEKTDEHSLKTFNAALGAGGDNVPLIRIKGNYTNVSLSAQ